MFFVALARLITSVDVEAPALATDLGATAYEARLAISGALPAILFSSPDRARAVELYNRVGARGHGVIFCSEAEVVPSGDMIAMRRFRLDGDAVVAEDTGDRLPYEDVFAIIRATHKSSESTRKEVVEKKLDVGRAIMTSGLLMSRSTTRSVVTGSEVREGKAYFFRRNGERPWLLSENGTQYTGLGGMLAPTRAVNFVRTIDVLRERMRMATYDDRLLQVRKVPERIAATTAVGHLEASQVAGMDMLAHVLAAWLAQGGGAYR